MSDSMEDLAASLHLDRVPRLWALTAYPSQRPLGSWLADLQARITQLTDWIQGPGDVPLVTWISGLFNPQSFLTGMAISYLPFFLSFFLSVFIFIFFILILIILFLVYKSLQKEVCFEGNCFFFFIMNIPSGLYFIDFLLISYVSYCFYLLSAVMQATAQGQGLELDKLTLVTEVTRKVAVEEITTAAKDGTYIVGLYLEGAAWSAAHATLESSKPREMFHPLPVINIRPAVAERLEAATYYCPVYKTQQRGSTYVFSMQL